MVNKLIAALMLLPSLAGAQEAPLSAIEWLSMPSTLPTTRAIPQKGLSFEGPPVTDTAAIPEVSVKPLGEATSDAVGLLPGSVTGLPNTLWQSSSAAELADLLQERHVARLPAMQSLLYTLLLAEADAPDDQQGQSRFLEARIDALIALGAVEPAQALLERAGANTPPLFQRWFNTTLLTGDEHRACAALRARPYLSPSYAARVFCTARGGDWQAAALTLDAAMLLGKVSEIEDQLLTRFLDPELFEGTDLPLPPVRPSPLLFRLYEAVGEPLPTNTLPRAFAMGDLRGMSGWKAELHAAERLTRTGALSVNRLLGVYSARRPAASGGIWDRVDAVQKFDSALKTGDPNAVSRTLEPAWRAMRAARLETPFAELYGADLMRLPLDDTASDLGFEVAMLGPDYEDAARLCGDKKKEREFASALAQGTPPESGDNKIETAIVEGFKPDNVPADMIDLLNEGRLGEVILRAIAMYESAADGDYTALPPALATLRAVGLEDSARRAALQMLFLHRRV